MNKWLKILGLGIVFLIVLLSVNEVILSKAGHLKSINNDADLWSIEREKIADLNEEAIVLIGASRMQVNIDLELLKKMFPNREILQLALSGRGCSFPVFKDLVTNTDFKGIIIISENQRSLNDLYSKQSEVVSYYNSFTLDNKLNKKISMWFENRFLFLNTNSNSERLYGNLFGKMELPAPVFTKTYDSREQTSFFDITDTKSIYIIRINGVKKKVLKTPEKFSSWKKNLNLWKGLVDSFKRKGGKTIFVHMPFSKDRWELENKWKPKNIYWDEAMHYLGVSNIHFADYAKLQNYELPDTSHLNASSKKDFTYNMSIIFKDKMESEF